MLWRLKIAAQYLALLIRSIFMYRYSNMTTLSCDLENVSREPLLLVWNAGTWPSLLCHMRQTLDNPWVLFLSTCDIFKWERILKVWWRCAVPFRRFGVPEFRSGSEIARKQEGAMHELQARYNLRKLQSRHGNRSDKLCFRHGASFESVKSAAGRPAIKRRRIGAFQVAPGSSQARRLSLIGRAPPPAMAHKIRCKSYTGKKRQESLGGNDHKTMAIQIICVSTAAFSGVVT